MEGKLKEKLESLGLALLCISTSSLAGPAASLSGWLGMACFALSIRFAVASLEHKLAKWTPVQDAAASAAQQQQQKTK